MHDPQVFEKPFEFNPERYLKDGKIDRSVPDSELAAFGHGRRYVIQLRISFSPLMSAPRICPGRQFSNDGLFLTAASILSVFSVSAPKDNAGNPIYPKLEIKNPSIA
jgi:cytochrome P450